jgi:hypothetical protein
MTSMITSPELSAIPLNHNTNLCSGPHTLPSHACLREQSEDAVLAAVVRLIRAQGLLEAKSMVLADASVRREAGRNGLRCCRSQTRFLAPNHCGGP